VAIIAAKVKNGQAFYYASQNNREIAMLKNSYATPVTYCAMEHRSGHKRCAHATANNKTNKISVSPYKHDYIAKNTAKTKRRN